ncbi:metal-dependent transcriptional regulator [Chryseobacterium sp. MFBS3-17]|uniref:metal-dependent transcriptional regulator n=1 Tax=Chryseobacterium sp. MFBS3-17 TaxID=2886689 RepID=UPI001D0E87A3|nr:metal-dependent transcriptional regulator [Chryseobacterium sp. MFBS3-17]MCC2589850.1 metal-dependent transcriptional regulator [Chryseobacterium sp. MFBS3-17]
MRNTLTEENYLKAIFHLKNEDHTVTVSELSKFLNVKMPSVNNMMKKFADKKWVMYETYQPLIITDKGMKEASLVVRKHRLTEMFLVERMNFGWEDVHEIAEQLEHVHSTLFFDKMDEILNFPKFDPHGEPIPDKDGNIIAQDLKKLSSCRVGDRVIFKAVTYSNHEFLNYLNDRNITLETEMEILKIEDFDQTLHVRTGSGSVMLSPSAADKILVK